MEGRDSFSDRIDYLWKYYDEHAQQARQHETLRANATSIIGAIMAALVALASVGGFSRSDAATGLLVVLLGVLGTLISLKHYERNRLHTAIMNAARREIELAALQEDSYPRLPSDVRTETVAKHNSTWTIKGRHLHQGSDADDPPISPIVRCRLSVLWALVPAMIGLVGLAVIYLAV